MNRVFKNALLAGCCSLGMGMGYAQKQDAEHEAVQFFSTEYKFLPYQLVTGMVDRIDAQIKNPQKLKNPVAIPLGHSIDEEGMSRNLVITRVHAGDQRIVAFNAQQSVKNAQAVDDDVLLASAGRSYLAYKVGLLDSLAVEQRKFNENFGTNIKLMVSMEPGVGAAAIRESYEGQWTNSGSILMSGELLSQLEMEEAIAIQSHELGHFDYFRMKDPAERKQRLDEMLHELGYQEGDIPQLDNVGEEVYADIYAMKNLVEKYGEGAKDIMQGALVKVAALSMGDKADALGTGRERILKQMYDQQMDMMMLENDHPHMLVRMDVVDKAAQYYLKK